MNAQPGRRVVLLDRDGTINIDKSYLSDPDQLELIDGVGPALHHLQRLGFALVVVTNQSGVARGMFEMEAVDRIHARLAELLSAFDVRLDGIYTCPHGASQGCTCRKPMTGLVDQARAELGIDPRMGVMIGDKPSDIELGRRVGARTVLVRTGYGREVESRKECCPDLIVDAMPDAVEWIALSCPSDQSR